LIVSISRADVNWNESASDLWRRILDTRQFFVSPQHWDEEVGSKKLWRVSDLWRIECGNHFGQKLAGSKAHRETDGAFALHAQGEQVFRGLACVFRLVRQPQY
jgi:hypothetical protein